MALALGIPKVDRLLQALSGIDLVEWMAYWELEPFGEERADYRMATLAALIANTNRDPDKCPEPFTTENFMPQFGPQDDKQEPPKIDKETALVAIREAMMGLVVASKGQDLREKL